MTTGTHEHAALANDAYQDRSALLSETVSIDDVSYEIIAAADRPSGYQGTAYQRVDTGVVVIAHRGTESVKDGVTDAGMAVLGHNNQLDDAMAFTQHAIDTAKRTQAASLDHFAITVTGHSLGGTLAQITAAKHGLRAETFNAYGPASLTNLHEHGVDVNGQYPGIVNHVRATDVVGAGSPHFGEVRIYATPQDVESLKRGRYLETGLHLPTNPFLATDLSAHKMSNFLPGNDVTGSSIINPVNEARARAHQGAIGHFHKDVGQSRVDVAMVSNRAHSPLHALNPFDPAVKLRAQAIDAGLAVTGQIVVDGLTQHVRVAQRVGQQTVQLVSDGASGLYDAMTGAPSARLDQQAHPDHSLFKQAQAGVHQMDAKVGRTPDGRSDNLAASLAAAARNDGLKRIDHVVLSTDGSKVFAVQGALDSPLKKISNVPTIEALDMPIAQSTASLGSALRQQDRLIDAHSQDQQRSGAALAM